MASATLNEKQFRFAEAFIGGKSKLKSAEEAGVMSSAASAFATRMFNNQNVVKYIDERKKEIHDQLRAEIEVDDLWITKQFKEVYNRCMQRVAVMKFDKERGEYVQATDEEGEGVWTFDSNGAIRALENIGKHIGYFEVDNRQKQAIIKVSITRNTIQNNIILQQGETHSGELTEGGD